MQWWVPVTVAIIGGPLMWFLARFDRNNTKQHSSNMHVLQRIEGKVDNVEAKLSKVDDRLNSHIDWHQHRIRPPWWGGLNGRNVRGNSTGSGEEKAAV